MFTYAAAHRVDQSSANELALASGITSSSPVNMLRYDNQRLLLAKMMAYQHPEVVARLERKLSLSNKQAVELFDDVKRFLFLCVTSSKALAPTKKIDDGWHEFILFTKDYTMFGNEYYGRFIHHRPNPVLSQHVAADPADTIEMAQRVFGVLSHNWTAQSAGCYCSNHSCDKDCSGCSGD